MTSVLVFIVAKKTDSRLGNVYVMISVEGRYWMESNCTIRRGVPSYQSFIDVF